MRESEDTLMSRGGGGGGGFGGLAFSGGDGNLSAPYGGPGAGPPDGPGGGPASTCDDGADLE